MRHSLPSLIYLLLITSLTGQVSIAEEGKRTLEVITEATPFTILKESKEHGGEATIFVNRILKQANIAHQTSYIPWKRSYQYAKSKPNVLIYPIARTKHRENEFIWVGRIIPINYYLFKLKQRRDISLKRLEDAKQYSIGVVNKHVHHEYLASKEFTEMQTVNNSSQNLRKLLSGRIDLFPLSSGGLLPLCAESGVDCDMIVPAIALEKFSQGLYMAFNKDSDPTIVESVRQSYLELVNSTEYQRLFEHRKQTSEKIEAMQKLDYTPLTSENID